MMKYLLIVLLFLSGCSDKEQQANAYSQKRRGEARQEAFYKCMELASKNTRAADDDVSDIVKECESASYYITIHVK
jgi:hypothetical protein